MGSEHCTSDGHITDSEDAQEGIQRENREIKLLKDCLVKQGRGSLITWIQEVVLSIDFIFPYLTQEKMIFGAITNSR